MFSFSFKLVRNLINVKGIRFPAEKGSSCLHFSLGDPVLLLRIIMINDKERE